MKDKCIRNIKLKLWRMFIIYENYFFYVCVERNSNVKRVVKDFINRLNLDKSIIILYFGIFKMRLVFIIIEIGGYLGVMMLKLMEEIGVKYYVVLEFVFSFYKNFIEKIKEL